MAGAGDAGLQSIGRSTNNVDPYSVGTEKGRFKTGDLYTGPKRVWEFKSPCALEEKSMEFIGQGLYDPDNESIHFIGQRD